MLVFDDAGLMVRTNPAFEALVERVPVLLAEAAPDLQQLLAWEGGAPRPRCSPARRRSSARRWLPLPDGRRRRLRARVRGYATTGGQRRVDGGGRGPQRRGRARPGAAARSAR